MGSNTIHYPDFTNTVIVLNLLNQIIKYLPTEERSGTVVWIDFVRESDKIIKAIIYYDESIWEPKTFVYV